MDEKTRNTFLSSDSSISDIVAFIEDRELAIEKRVDELLKSFNALKDDVDAFMSEENGLLCSLKQSHESVESKLSHVHSVINVHNEHYSEMAYQMKALSESNKKMAGFLMTLEKIRAMLDLAASHGGGSDK